jgi:hypothetical protein
MADNTFRSYRSHDPLARGQAGPRGAASDPLAELARLIGQGDPYAEGATHQDTTAPGWAPEERYAEADHRADEPYDPPAPPPATYQSHEPQERGYETEAPPTGGRFFSGPAATFNGFREEADGYDHDEPPPGPPARQVPAYATAPDDGYEALPQHGDISEAYAADDYYDDAPSPRGRSGLVVVIAILSLAVVGTAGAFGYRAMFGGSVLPTLPPIIKASNGPNKIVPNAGEAQANSGGQAGAATTGSTENLVPREEQPVNMEPPKAAPRVVSTIPIINGQGSVPPGMTAPGAPEPAASASNSPWPPSPGGAAPPGAMPTPAPMPLSPGQVSAEPKKIHTVTIRADQAGGAETSAVAPVARSSARQASAAPKPSTMASAPPAGANAPLSIVPGGQAEAAAPARPRVAATHAAAAPPTALASAGPAAGVTAPASSGSGYSVQVTSQRSEAEAQAAFRALRAKFPAQLSGREPIIHRADLGDKGTYYRALVGPFASAEQAAGICSGMKAAGGNCIVQRN